MSENGHGIRTYLLVFLALMVLTAVTVWVAFQDLGRWNDIVAIGIAITKATLVVLWFMHVADSTKLSKLVVVSGFFWLLILFGLTMTDYLSRDLIDNQRSVPGVAAPPGVE